MAFSTHKGIVLISIEVVLKEVQPSGKLLIQAVGLLCVPKLVMVSADQDFPSGKRLDILHVLFAFRDIPAKAVVADQHKRILRLQ